MLAKSNYYVGHSLSWFHKLQLAIKRQLLTKKNYKLRINRSMNLLMSMQEAHKTVCGPRERARLVKLFDWLTPGMRRVCRYGSWAPIQQVGSRTREKGAVGAGAREKPHWRWLAQCRLTDGGSS
jgi:hypothetical protein